MNIVRNINSINLSKMKKGESFLAIAQTKRLSDGKLIKIGEKVILEREGKKEDYYVVEVWSDNLILSQRKEPRPSRMDEVFTLVYELLTKKI